MNDRQFQSPSELHFAEQLREGACRERPQFSEALHARIMETISSEAPRGACGFARQSEGSGEKALLRRIYLRNAAWLISAAAAVVAIIWAGSLLGRAGGNREVARIAPPPIASADSKVAVLNRPATASNSPRRELGSSNDSAVDDGASELADAIVSAVPMYTLDDLGRDARTTANLLVDRLPFAGSADEWGP